MSYTITKQQVERIINRSLTSVEEENFEDDIKNAASITKELLGIDWDVIGDRSYDSREGYSTIFTDPYTSLTTVKKNDKTVAATDYHGANDDDRNSQIKNSIVFNRTLASCDTVTVAATWGFGEKLPVDLLKLIVAIWQQETSPIIDTNKAEVRSKSIEDFSQTFDTSKTASERFKERYGSTIAKYQNRNNGSGIEHGYIRSIQN